MLKKMLCKIRKNHNDLKNFKILLDIDDNNKKLECNCCGYRYNMIEGQIRTSTFADEIYLEECLKVKMLNCFSSSNSDNIEVFNKYAGTVFEEYENLIDQGSIFFDRPYRILKESSIDDSLYFMIVSNEEFLNININRTTPDNNLKNIIGSFIVFDKKASKIRVMNEEYVNEYV